jgi:restriction system protein
VQSKTLFSNRFHWAKTYMTKAGLLEPVRRGYFRITDRGRQVLIKSPNRIDNTILAQFSEFQDFVRPKPDVVSEPTETNDGSSPAAIAISDRTPLEIIRAAQLQIESALATDLIDRVRAMPAEFFERLVVRLVVAMGYWATATEAARAIGRSGDKGVDGVIHQDLLGLDRVYIQAKRYGASVNVGGGDIRDFYGSLALHKASKGVFITTSSFTRQAIETAAGFPSRIVLIDGAQLAALMIRYNIGCRTEETVLIKRVDEDFFE